MTFKNTIGTFFKSNNSPFFAIALLVVYAVLVCLKFEPYWQGNDDVGMLMIAHGIGNITESDPRLVYSSIFWAYIVQALHTSAIAGYTSAMYGTLALSFTIITFCLSRFVRSYFLLTVPVLAVSLLVPLLSPQFTVTASCATIAAIFSSYTYIVFRQTRYIVAAIVMGLLGFWIRHESFFMICFFSIPIFPWRQVLRDKAVLASAAVFFTLFAFTAWLDRLAYTSEPEWAAFEQWDRVRGSFSGYRAAEEILADPQIHQSFGFSSNDIKLMECFFFADPKFINPDALQSMMNMTEHAPTKWYDAYLGMAYFWQERQLKYLALTAVLLLILFGTQRVFLCYLLTLGAFFIISFNGHPPTFRVHVSSLIFLCPLTLLIARGKQFDFKTLFSKIQHRYRVPANINTYIACICMVIFAHTSFKFFKKTIEAQQMYDTVYHEFTQVDQYIQNTLPNKIIIHGSFYPVESLYRPFDAFTSYSDKRFAWIASGSSAPYNYTYGDTSPEWFLHALADSAITLVTDKNTINMLRTWTQERMNRRLIVLNSYTFKLKDWHTYSVYTVTTEPIEAQINF